MISRKTKRAFGVIGIVLAVLLSTFAVAQAGISKSANGKRNAQNNSADVATRLLQTQDAVRPLTRRTIGHVRSSGVTTTTRPARPKLVEVPCTTWRGPANVSGEQYSSLPTTCYVPESRMQTPGGNNLISQLIDIYRRPKLRMTEAEVKSVADLTSVPMPVPSPVMSAPIGVCGVEHQMDMRIPELIQVKPTQTSVGLLRGGAWGVFAVDWGDGTPKETFDFTGAPWPVSSVKHVWQTRGTYTISVTATWNFDWQVDRFHGAIPALVTTGTIPNYQVREAQAVVIG